MTKKRLYDCYSICMRSAGEEWYAREEGCRSANDEDLLYVLDVKDIDEECSLNKDL
jgi:hypothetical protein